MSGIPIGADILIADITPITSPSLLKTTDPEDPGQAKVFKIKKLLPTFETRPSDRCQDSPSGWPVW